jgi:hypothetical protein
MYHVTGPTSLHILLSTESPLLTQILPFSNKVISFNGVLLKKLPFILSSPSPDGPTEIHLDLQILIKQRRDDPWRIISFFYKSLCSVYSSFSLCLHFSPFICKHIVTLNRYSQFTISLRRHTKGPLI